ncbi:homing endonuclease associated repeat-containing protein [Halorubrum sp. FL23]|uniref:homing endonuclease associated repeat-containing protein n=1 Tax=Halorubrum sp. FL23 TaxID=3458704 RepID=UPI004034ABF4
MSKYSDQELLNQIRSLADGERPPTYPEFENSPETASAETVSRRFGSWDGAVRAAGHTYSNKNYSDQELLDQIRSLADGGRPPTGPEFQDCPETAASNTVRRRFGGWDGAVRAAGYTYSNKNYSDQELLDQIRSLADGEKPPTGPEFRDCPETVAVETVRRRFGSWDEAVRAAGFTHSNKNYSDQELLDQIRSLADGEKPPTGPEFRDRPETVTASTVRRRFGSWNEAVRAAGYTPRKEGKYSEKELIEALKRASSEGDVKKIKDDTVSSCDFPSKETYRLQFGGVGVAALRGSISIDCSSRQKAVPLNKMELCQLVEQIPQIDPYDQAVIMVSLLTGCDKSEHKWVAKEGIEDTKTGPVIIFPLKAKRGSRSVSVGVLYNQLVKEFDPICSGRLKQSIEFSGYPPEETTAHLPIRRTSRAINFDINRPVVNDLASRSGPQVLQRDLRCTHYLFEYCRGASQAMLKRRLALSDNEIEHYHRFLDDPKGDNGWSVKIE